VSIKYDGDGNRIFNTVAGVTTAYLMDDRNPTGYVQVLAEVQGGAITRSYVYGLELIEQDRVSGTQQATSYNVYDGHGSVRALTDTTGAVTDTYDYDALRQPDPLDGLNAEQLSLRRRTVRPRPPPLVQPRHFNIVTGGFWIINVLGFCLLEFWLIRHSCDCTYTFTIDIRPEI